MSGFDLTPLGVFLLLFIGLGVGFGIGAGAMLLLILSAFGMDRLGWHVPTAVSDDRFVENKLRDLKRSAMAFGDADELRRIEDALRAAIEHGRGQSDGELTTSGFIRRYDER